MIDETTIKVYLPVAGSQAAAIVDPRSAVVAHVVADVVVDGAVGSKVAVYVEGNRYGAENLRLWADRVDIAAGRLVHSYPTVARFEVDGRDLEEVGWYDPDAGVVMFESTDARSRVAEWSGENADGDLGLSSRARIRREAAEAVVRLAGKAEPGVRKAHPR
jgi:hypothetical protein